MSVLEYKIHPIGDCQNTADVVNEERERREHEWDTIPPESNTSTLRS